METAISLLAGSISNRDPPASPTKQTTAISAIEENENLEPLHFTAAVNFILKNPSIATIYLAIRSPAARTAFLQNQLSTENGIAF
jgi:hypothetical protein